MRAYLGKSIHRKFMALMLLTLLVVNVPLLAIYVGVMKRSLNDEFNDRNNALLTTNAASLEKPLWDFDYDSLPSWADTMLLEKNICEVRIYDHRETLLVSVESAAQDHWHSHGDHSVLSTIVEREVDGKIVKVGRLQLHFDHFGIAETIWSVVLKSLLLMSISIGAILLAALFFNRYWIDRPIFRLMKAIAATQATGRKHLVEFTEDDEIARVSASFNDMQNKLESESLRIKRAYKRLTDWHNNTPALLYSLDSHGVIRAVSDFWLAETGYGKAEVIGRRFSDFIPEQHLAEYLNKPDTRGLKAGEFAEVTCAFRKQDGTIIDILIRETIDSDSLTGEQMTLAVMTDFTSMRKAKDALRVLAETDSLTGLMNREGVANVIRLGVEEASATGSSMGLLFLDMDRFKWVNDNLGHGAGDELLQLVSNRVSGLTQENEFVGRFGGDEFAVVVKGENAVDRVVELAEAIQQALGETHCIRGHDFKVAVSIGIAIYPDHAKSASELIKSADVAMYHRKNSGRNGYTLYDQKLGQHAGQFLEIEQLINQALANDWFELHLQPIIDIQEDRMTGLEALLRLNHPENGLMPPQQIIETAEKSTQILEIGDRVIDLAIEHLATFQTIPLLKDCYLTVNLSAAQFLPGLPAKLATKLMQHGLPPEKLVLEITETVLMQEIEHLGEIFDAISALGCRFALDDFGTGYSSLSYLNEFPVSILKIDRSFVRMMADAESHPVRAQKTQTLLQGIVAMTHELNLDVVIEGVETEEDAERVHDLAADMAQGYYYSRPVPIDQFIEDARWASGAMAG
ncbi:putative bifunctional diguanylate cyclase/phosphodiesterase [Cohaesibacter intestini]|uniref:putative bifunctional diguanylate cyclase/phosphodiesterase n=1 Tax=Cohaesibacter intestini TaxID=2211145 RepID=UPI0018E4F710|nr:EAL domain-containing protein [Cohaesibacter intestini]